MEKACAARPLTIHNFSILPLSCNFTSCTSVFPGKIWQACCLIASRPGLAVRLQATKPGGVEPDLCEDYQDIYATAGEGKEDLFPWGIADGAHSWHEGDDGTFIEGIQEVITSAGGPTGFQAVISWLFLPGFFTALAFQVEPTYLFIYAALFIFAFIGIEMDKPPKESEFEPERYRLDK